MKITLTNQILYAVLALCVVLAMVFSLQAVSLNGDLRNYNGRAQAINNCRNTVQALTVDCVEYSKMNQDIVPLLQQAGVLGNKPMAPKPATK